LEVTLKQGAAQTTVPVNEIVKIQYSGEPSLLRSVRTAIDEGRYEDAVASLERIKPEDAKRPAIKQDLEFYQALAKAHIALAGSDDQAVVEAGKLMGAFVRRNTDSYHFLEGCRVLGDLYVAVGQYAAAQQYYAQLGKAPWPEYKMRAAVALGWALLAEGKSEQALASFQSALDTRAQGALADAERLAATLGKARCQAEAGKSDEAVKLVEDVIARASPEKVELHAQAYNALGIAHAKAGRPQDALLAFLHVDLLYFKSRKDHIEALENLVELWPQVQKPERADEAVQKLQEQYKRSPRSN
jgi:tetratricopeptide (TPR) repeat protein